MIYNVLKKNCSQGKNLLMVALLFFTAASYMACVAAIPVIIYRQATKIQKATVQVPASADSVYQAALKLIQKKPNIEITKQEDAKHFIEIKQADKFAAITVTKIDSRKSQLIVSADADTEENKKEDKEEDKELALKIITAICDELGVQYTVLK